VPDASDHFDTNYIFTEDTLAVYYNGLLQQPAKFTEDGDWSGFTTLFSPVAGDTLTVFYFRELSQGDPDTIGIQEQDGSPALTGIHTLKVGNGDLEPDTIGIQEQDGSPALTGIHTLKVGNGDLEDLGSGIARVQTAADVIVGVSDQDVIMMQVFS
jgi:hypothetical protein